MKTCAYCGREWQARNETCVHCGAPVKNAVIEKYEPFFYEGYIVYCLREPARRCFSYVFYKGVTFMGRVDVDDRELEQLSPTFDPMPMIMERLQTQ